MIKVTKDGKEVIYNDNNTLVEDAAESMEQYGIKFEDAMMEFNCMEEAKAVEVAAKIFESKDYAKAFATKVKERVSKWERGGSDKASKVTESGQLIVNLYWRWLDEKKYEDINEYGKVLSEKLGFPVKMTKKPFGFKFDNYQVKVTGGNKAKIEVLMEA